MATYLQGVTDYIPDYQPFQPDLNFYGNLLQTKQTQYDTNWKQLNNLYGQLYGAELTHDQNIQKKDGLLKQIDFNLKRVSGLDLSLEQNVNQAMQVFRPFYEDKYLMKDMAWTKNWTNTYNSSNALKTSQDEEQRKQWWSTGIQGLELRRQMFKDATLDETLTMQNSQYTPFVNTLTEYLDLTKKYNLDKYQTIPDQSGLYLVKRKNGELILPSLQNIFAAEYANRPDIQDMYREQAFVERMGYAYQNAERFGGSNVESEKDYIRNKLAYIKQYAKKKNAEAQDKLNNTQNLQGQLEEQVKKGNVNPHQNNYAKSLEELFQVESAVANQTEKLNNQVNDNQATVVSQGYQSDDEDIGDIELARLKVDAGYASIAAEQDIYAAAAFYADATSSIEYKANPVGLEYLRHQHALQRDRKKAEARDKEIDKIATNKLKEMKIKKLLDSGYIDIDPKTGEVDWNAQNNGFNLIRRSPGDPGQSTSGKYTFEELQTMFENDQADQFATKPVGDIMKTIQNGVSNNKFSAYELATLVKTFRSTDPLASKILKEGSKNHLPDIKKVWNAIFEQYNNSPKEFIRKVSQNGQIFATNSVMDSWATKHTGDDFANTYLSLNSRSDMQQLERSARAFAEIDNENLRKVRTKLTSDVQYIMQTAAKNNPNVVYDEDKIDQAVDRMLYRYTIDGNGHNSEFDDLAAELDGEISNILGFRVGKKTNTASEASWLNYLIPMTYAFKDERENVEATASWTKDVFDNSFEELTVLHPDNGGLSPYFINMTNFGGARDQYGLASETMDIKVASGVRMDPGNQSAVNMFDIINGINWNNNKTQYRITTQGNILSADPEADTGISQAEALAIVNRLALEINGPDSDKLGNFYISSSDVAMEDGRLGSMTLRAPRSIIEEVISEKLDGDDNVIKSYVDNIYQSGITFIAPTEYWDANPLFSKSMPTPIETILRNKDIEYADPLGGGHYAIKRVPGEGSYLISGQVYGMDENGDRMVKDIYWPVDKTQGRLIGEKEKQFYEQLNNVNAYNFQMFRQIHQSGDAVKIQNAEKNFGANVNKPNWNYNE
jgi:hypothetical protein